MPKPMRHILEAKRRSTILQTLESQFGNQVLSLKLSSRRSEKRRGLFYFMYHCNCLVWPMTSLTDFTYCRSYSWQCTYTTKRMADPQPGSCWNYSYCYSLVLLRVPWRHMHLKKAIGWNAVKIKNTFLSIVTSWKLEQTIKYKVKWLFWAYFWYIWLPGIYLRFFITDNHFQNIWLLTVFHS